MRLEDGSFHAITPQEKMTALARTFPAMRHKMFEDAEGSGLEPFNAVRLASASAPWSRGEKLVVAFLLMVWNPEQELFLTFNPADAAMFWDYGQRKAYATWMMHPFFC